MDLDSFFEDLDEILDLPIPGNAEGLELESSDDNEGEVLQ